MIVVWIDADKAKARQLARWLGEHDIAAITAKRWAVMANAEDAARALALVANESEYGAAAEGGA